MVERSAKGHLPARLQINNAAATAAITPWDAAILPDLQIWSVALFDKDGWKGNLKSNCARSTEWSKSGALKAVMVFSLYTTTSTLWNLIGLNVKNASGIYWPLKVNPEFTLAWVILSTRVLRILAWDWYAIYQASEFAAVEAVWIDLDFGHELHVRKCNVNWWLDMLFLSRTVTVQCMSRLCLWDLILSSSMNA